MTTSDLSSARSEMTEEQKAERRRVVTNNKAWEIAARVRRDYVTELLSGTTVPGERCGMSPKS